jgi:hypothetical protein
MEYFSTVNTSYPQLLTFYPQDMIHRTMSEENFHRKFPVGCPYRYPLILKIDKL